MSVNSSIFDLAGKSAIVTGAGLLGRQFTRALADAGASITVADIDKAAVVEAVAMSGESGRVAGDVVDVCDRGSIASLVRNVVQRSGSIDILVNAAAIDAKFSPGHRHEQSFEDQSVEAWNEALSVNLTGMFLTCQAVVPVMQRHDGGSIINIASTYGMVAPDQRIYVREGQPTQFKPACYAVTKAGVIGLTRYLAAYLAGTGIRVNSLSPGGVFAGHDEEFVRAYSYRTMLGRMARQDELNGAVIFLAADASSYMTGSNLVVDGGWTAW
jgi:NAD(P)-dependent dehydrogenase (short-subunit alcohol dehydrogenase family)